MTNTVRRLMGLLLCACLLLAGLAALAEDTGALTIELKPREGDKFTVSKVSFEAWRIAKPSGSLPSGWEGVGAFAGMDFTRRDDPGTEDKMYSASQVNDMILQVRTLISQGSLAPDTPRIAIDDATCCAVFTGLPLGMYYVRCVVADDLKRFSLQSYGGADQADFLVAVNDDSAKAELSGKYTLEPLKKIDVRVEKLWEDDDDIEKKRPGSVTVQLMRMDPGAQEGQAATDDAGAQLRLTLSDENEWHGEWKDLPGTDDDGNEYLYTVEEIKDAQFAEDYPDTAVSYNIVNAEGSNPALAFRVVNKREVKYGKLIIKKNVTVNGKPAEDEFKDKVNLTYHFIIEGPGLKEPAKVAVSVRDGVSGEATKDNLVAGIYTVTETDLPEGMVGSDPVTVEVITDQETEVPVAEFTNDLKLGSIVITKNVTVDGEPTEGTDADGTYSFTVANETNYSKVITITVVNGKSEPAKVEGLVPGEYTVTEATGSDAMRPGMKVVGDASVGVTVEYGKETPVEFTNNLEKADLLIYKLVKVNGKDPEPESTEADGAYTFEVKNADGEAVATATITVVNGKSEPAKVEGLVPGEYTVTEKTDALPEGMRVVGSGTEKVTVKAGAENKVTFTNDKSSGSLAVTKRVTVGGKAVNGSEADGTYSFEVKNADGESVGTLSVTIENGVSATSTPLKNLAPGEYTVTEIDLPEGMRVVGEGTVNVTVVAGEQASVSFTNDKPAGSLRVTKEVTVNGNPTNSSLADGVYSFDVLDAEGGLVKTLNIQIRGGVSGSDVADGLAPGSYTVVEKSDFAAKGVRVVGSGTQNVTVEVDQEASVSFTNNIDVGDIQITKHVTVGGAPTEGTEADGTYHFAIVDSAGETVRTTSITITNGQSNTAVVSGLPIGEYTVIETGDMPKGMGAVGSNSRGVTVTTGGTAEVSFTNDLQPGALRITKHVTVNGESTTGDAADNTYTFTVKDDAGKVNRTVSITIEKGASKSVVVGGLPAGDYTVTEVNVPNGMRLTAGDSGVKVTVEAGEEAEVPVAEFTNDLILGSLRIVKTMTITGNGAASASLPAGYAFKFHVVGPDYDETVSIPVTREAGSASMTLRGLTPGEYTVTEVDIPSGFVPSATTMTKNVTVDANNSATVEFPFENVMTITATPTVRPVITPVPTDTPEPTPTPTITPTPTPTPTPTVEVMIRKRWDDQDDARGKRPSTITVQLLRDGVQIDSVTFGGSGSYWAYRFTGLPAVDETGKPYSYTARENTVPYYSTSISGTDIVNTIDEQPPTRYTRISGTKTWSDGGNSQGKRPNYITVRLLRDGQEVGSRTVTAANGWSFSFDNLPADDGYGNEYHYTVKEDSVSGYYGRVSGYSVTNSVLPDRPNMPPMDNTPPEETTRFTGTPTPLFGQMTDEDFEEAIDLFGYGTPLWGEPLKTGDEVPIYPIVFGSIGAAALIALIVIGVIGKRKKKSA